MNKYVYRGYTGSCFLVVVILQYFQLVLHHILVDFTCHFYSSLFLFLFLLYAYHVSYRLYLQLWGTSFSQQRLVDVGEREIGTVSSKHFSFHGFSTVNYLLERCCIIFVRDILVFGLIFNCICTRFVSMKFLRFIFLHV